MTTPRTAPTKAKTVRKTKASKPAVKKRVLHVYINTDADTTVKVHQWKLQPVPKTETPDYPRVDVQTEELSYSVILDPSEPKVETWEVNALGQLGKHPIATSGLPFVDRATL